MEANKVDSNFEVHVNYKTTQICDTCLEKAYSNFNIKQKIDCNNHWLTMIML